MKHIPDHTKELAKEIYLIFIESRSYKLDPSDDAIFDQAKEFALDALAFAHTFFKAIDDFEHKP